MQDRCKVLCSAHCIHNTNSGYYSVCKHPEVNYRYAVFTRIYLESCKRQERGEDHGTIKRDVQED